MSTNAPACLRCKTTMDRGFILDAGNQNIPRVSRWVAGAPEKSFWSGLKLRERAVYSILTYRCSRCGYLESYAPADGSADADAE